MRRAVDEKGVEYYEYILLYVDDCLAIGSNPQYQVDQINKYFPMKPGSVGPPKMYLGAKIGKMTLKNGAEAYYFSMAQSVNEAVRNVENYLATKDLK